MKPGAIHRLRHAKFLGYLTPSPLCPRLGLNFSDKSTQPPLLRCVLDNTPHPSQCVTYFMDGLLLHPWSCHRNQHLRIMRAFNWNESRCVCNVLYFTHSCAANPLFATIVGIVGDLKSWSAVWIIWVKSEKPLRVIKLALLCQTP